MRFIGLLYILLAFSNAFSYELTGDGKQYIDEFLLYEDSSNSYTLEQISALHDGSWTSLRSNSLNLGYRSTTVWIKFKLSNPSNKAINRLLDINYPLLDFVSLYEQSPQQDFRLIMESGDSRPFNSRNIMHPNFVNPVSIEASSEHAYIASIKSNAPIQSQFIVWQFDDFQDHYRSLSNLTFFYLGLILSAALFNLFVYAFLREKVYLVYGSYVAFFAMFITSQNAILFQYLFSSTPQLHNWSQIVFACGSVSLMALFNFYYLNLRMGSPFGKSLMALSIIPIVILISSPALSYPLTIKAIVYFALLSVPACFFIGVYTCQKGSDRNYYLLAWSWFIAGIIIFLMAKLGILPFSTITNNAIQIGSTLELLTFAAALGRRIHIEKETRLQAQKILIEGTRHSAELQKELLYQATHNSITGLPNKNYFESWLNDILKQKSKGILVLIKLSRISEIEKTLGTKFAEEALETFAARLNGEFLNLTGIQFIEPSENFVLATIDTSTHAFYIHPAVHEQFITEMNTIIEQLNAPLTVSNMEIEPYIRISYASHTNNEQASQLLRKGAIALEQTSSTQNISEYKSNEDQYNEKRLNLMRELKEAILDDSLSLDFQPLIDTQTGAYLGAEALVRWPHKDHGLIMPDQFIEVAERTGVIQSLSLWVIKNAITCLKSWQKIKPNFLLAINISASNLQDKKFMDTIHFLFHEHQDITKNIILEITETQMMTDTKSALKNLWQLSELGFHIAIDDFGTGYSNLAYLKKLPASELKIDKSFILNLESDRQNQVLVHTAIEMAHNLGLKVVAEGVESEKSRLLLKEMNCDMCQGFHICRPVSKNQIEALLKAN
jgi:EAL domain-containing protein (putative c-di-GMP-specific phosphodiesterase class I)/GGDEF domain-containing protein